MSYLSNYHEETEEEIPIDTHIINPLPDAMSTVVVTEDPLADANLMEFGAPKTEPDPLNETASFCAKMEKKIEDVINESVLLLDRDPREYHPFYLRVFEYIKLGQELGHIPLGGDESLKIWKKFDKLAVEKTKAEKTKPTPLLWELSSCYDYMKTKKEYVDGQLVKERVNDKERAEMIKKLESKAKQILNEFPCEDIKRNLGLRLRLFKECCTVTRPADCIKVNVLWKKFCSNFGKKPGTRFSSAAPAPNTQTPALNRPQRRVVVKVQVNIPTQRKVEDISLQDPASLDDEPSSPSAEEVELKFTPSSNLKESKTKEEPKKIQISSSKSKKIGAIGNSKKRKANNRVVSGPVKKSRLRSSTKSAKASRIKTKTRQKPLKRKSSLTKFQWTASRKRLKMVQKRPLLIKKPQKILPVLEKQINVLTKNLKKRNRLVKFTPKPKNVSTNSTANELGTIPDFSVCDECGQSYRTQHLDAHKQAVHNPFNIGNPCPICFKFFMTSRFMWSHFLSVHMPDHVNPEKISQEVPGITVNIDNDDAAVPDNEGTVTEDTSSTGNNTIHEDKDNTCEVCSKPFQTAAGLWKHKVDVHGIVSETLPTNWDSIRDSIQCEYCGESNLAPQQYLIHAKNIHPDMLEEVRKQLKERRQQQQRNAEKVTIPVKGQTNGKKKVKALECPKCGIILKRDLARHLQVVHGFGDGRQKIYRCPKPGCNKPYKARVSLKVHITERHDPVREKIDQKHLMNHIIGTPKKFQCSLCEWESYNKHECMAHIVLGHPHVLVEEGASVSAKCPHCEEVASTQEQIRIHAEILHPKDAWRCPHPECGRIILSPEDLQEHFSKDHNDDENEDKHERQLMSTRRRPKQINKSFKKNVLANKVNSSKKLAVKRLTKTVDKKEPVRKVGRPPKSGGSRKTKSQIQQRSRSGRILKRKRVNYTNDSSEEEDQQSSSDEWTSNAELSLPPPVKQTRTSTRTAKTRATKKLQAIQIEEIMSNLPLRIRKMFTKQCRVRVERLTPKQIKMYTKSIK